MRQKDKSEADAHLRSNITATNPVQGVALTGWGDKLKPLRWYEVVSIAVTPEHGGVNDDNDWFHFINTNHELAHHACACADVLVIIYLHTILFSSAIWVCHFVQRTSTLNTQKR